MRHQQTFRSVGRTGRPAGAHLSISQMRCYAHVAPIGATQMSPLAGFVILGRNFVATHISSPWDCQDAALNGATHMSPLRTCHP